jgi:hypothetical protein
MKRMALPLMLAAVASCGDPMLPADYAGPPAAAVKGNVLPGAAGTARDARNGRLSLEWLDHVSVSLVGQNLHYQRSALLQTDWDIGLSLPTDSVKFDAPVSGSRAARIGVGKIVYFDDRDNDGKLDWSCDRADCDRVMAVSSQFVLYVERPPYCQAFGSDKPKPRVSAGYHYYSLDTGALRELPASDPMSFTIIDRPPASVDPALELQAFTEYLIRVWGLNPTGGC